MKLLLTSAEFTNKTIINGLKGLVTKSFEQLDLVYIPTAANAEAGDKGWLIDDLYRTKELGFKSVDIVDISALSEEISKIRLKQSDIIMVGGGNTFHLMYWVNKLKIKELFASKVYVGISAGSCITGPTIYNSVQNLFEEKNEYNQKEGLGLVNFQFIPHLNAEYFPKIRKEYLEVAAKQIIEPIYALDDQSAVLVDGDKIEVVSEGKYLILNN
jgi:dipeptidase E